MAVALMVLLAHIVMFDYKEREREGCGIPLPKLPETFCMKRDATGNIVYTNGKIEVRILK